MILYTKHTQALERCTNSKEEKEVVQKVCHTQASHRHGTVHTGAYPARLPAPSGMPSSGSPHTRLLPLKQFFINKI